MKWITREHVKVDRVACPWLIKKFVDKDAEFLFVPPDKVMDEAKRLDAIPYDVKNVELGHHGQECSFEAILKKYKLASDPALVLLGKIVNGADTDNSLYRQPEGAGLEAIAEGFRHLGYKNDAASECRGMDLSMTRSMPIARQWCRPENRTAISNNASCSRAFFGGLDIRRREKQ